MRRETVIFRRSTDLVYANWFPCAVVGSRDLTEECEVFRASDDNDTVIVKKYEMGTVSIPDKVLTSDYIVHHYAIDAIVCRFDDKADNLTTEQIFALSELSHSALDAIATLLKTKTFRSEFRKSIRAQIDAWIAGKSQYALPLTDRQMNAIIPKV
jgi:hypothetical protein